MNETPRYASLRDYLRVLREQRLVIALVTLVAGGIALLVSLQQEPEYEAVAGIAFQDEAQQLNLLGGSISPRVPVEQTPQARAQTISEPVVMKRVQRALDEELPLNELEEAITTSLDEETFLVDAIATWSDPDFAAELANEFARQAASYTNQQARKDYDAVSDDVKAQRDDLTAASDPLERAALTQQLTRLRFLADNVEPAQIATTAQPPDDPTSPQTVRNTALGLILGLLLGIVVAFVRDSLDRRLRGTRDVHEALDYPVLGFVREDVMGRSFRSDNGYLPNLASDLEGFRIIRQNLEFLAAAGEAPRKRILVSSALPSEGKSTVAASIAFASAAAGRRTLLVECDLRRPALAQRLALRSQPGLTDYLVGNADPREILQALPPVLPLSGPNGAPEGAAVARADVGQSVVCITAGTSSPLPAELIGSERFRGFLEQVTKAYDAVILDTSPLLPVADTLEMLALADSVVLCVRSNQTTREQARASRTALEHFHDRPIGLVITGLRKRDEPEYAYYSYGDAYQASAHDRSAA